MNKTKREALARIKYLAGDKRKRVMLPEQVAWLEEKLAEIARLTEVFSVKPWRPR